MQTHRTLTASEAADRLGMTPQQVTDLCRTGAIKAIPQWRIHEEDLAAFAAKDAEATR